MTLEIPEVVINRLPVYARALAALAMDGETVVSSQTLGERLDVTPAQIRKDLSYFGRFGKQGRGYNVLGLLAKLREILGLDRKWRVALVGVGRRRLNGLWGRGAAAGSLVFDVSGVDGDAARMSWRSTGRWSRRGSGRGCQVGRQVGTAEGQLYDTAGRLYAHATTTCLVFTL